jgi:hypothetical protein
MGAVIYFNTNKTADIDSQVKGYVMPWEKKDALQLFANLRDWQEKYNPLRGPTSWADIKELRKEKHKEDLEGHGDAFFLFRDPVTKSRPDAPVTDVRVRGLWLKLMEKLEQELAEAGDTLDNGDPIRLILTRDKHGNPSSAAFDLHALRVTIITALYEEGMPPEYLMKIVGHHSVLMTLYYTKINAEGLTLKIDEAQLARQRKAQSEWTGYVTRASRKELESAVAYRHSSALDAIESATGIGMVVMDHGMCPAGAKRCHEGLAVTDLASNVTHYEAVPGGAGNCVRCRFFVTGPAFLFGLEAHVNDLSYRLKNVSFNYEKAQLALDELSDAHAESLSEGKPFNRHRELEIAETAFESATAKVDNIALSLQTAYALTEQCIRIASEDKSDGFSLVAAGGVSELEAVLSEAHEFEQVHTICSGATLFDGLNIDWKQANLERARMFDRMLRNSGKEPLFSLLDDDVALRVCNAMGKFLYARLDANSVHALIDGRTTLRALGLEKAFASQLKTLVPKTLSGTRQIGVLEES